jgi:hypothetical protein
MKFETNISTAEMERINKASLESVEVRLYEELLNAGFNPDTFDESALDVEPDLPMANSYVVIKKLLDARKLIMERLAN